MRLWFKSTRQFSGQGLELVIGEPRAGHAADEVAVAGGGAVNDAARADPGAGVVAGWPAASRNHGAHGERFVR